MDNFDLDGHEFVELNNLLKLTGMCPSGGIAKMMIADGQVRVNGAVELRKRCKIRSGQVVEFENRQVTII